MVDRPSLEGVLSAVAEEAGVTVSEICSDTKLRNIARPRQAAYWIANRRFGYSLLCIGEAIGNREHSTVLRGVRKIDRLISEEELNGMIRRVIARLGYLRIELTP
jgi:chromosomal replication initiator protein